MLRRRYILIALLPVLVMPALAQPPAGADPNSPLAQWYRSLRSPETGGSCCSEADCRPVDARIAGDRWQIKTDTGWQDVPPERVLHRENADGRALACRFATMIFCFVPPAGV